MAKFRGQIWWAAYWLKFMDEKSFTTPLLGTDLSQIRESIDVYIVAYMVYNFWRLI